MKLSVIMPAHNEEAQLEKSVLELIKELESGRIDYELIIVDDNSSDRTSEIVDSLSQEYDAIKAVYRKTEPGFGRAIKAGFDYISGDAVVIVMADSSDDPKDVVRYFRKIEEGYDCVFGSRFIKGAVVSDYPFLKLIINRIANNFIRVLFFIKENDITNAFKAYRSEVIKKISPLESEHFNITVELPLKAVVKGFSRVVIPINWYGRESGVSKLKLAENMKGYLWTVLKIWFGRIKIKRGKFYLLR